LRKLNTVGTTKEDLIHMPMGDDGKSMRYEYGPIAIRVYFNRYI
jgi:hypothetical protein